MKRFVNGRFCECETVSGLGVERDLVLCGCEKRLPNGMCGAIGFEEIGDLVCDAPWCDRECEMKRSANEKVDER